MAISGGPDTPVTRERVDALPYASVRAKVGKGPRGFLVLGRYAGEELHWISADRAVLATRHGRIVRTFGFAQDLRETRAVDTDPLATGAHRLVAPAKHTRLIDLAPDGPYQVPLISVLEPAGAAWIEILGIGYDTLHVMESGDAPSLEWQFRSEYWVDATTGFIWRSVQQVAPRLPAVEIEVLKPAAVAPAGTAAA
jgi:hypothetical protein